MCKQRIYLFVYLDCNIIILVATIVHSYSFYNDNNTLVYNISSQIYQENEFISKLLLSLKIKIKFNNSFLSQLFVLNYF